MSRKSSYPGKPPSLAQRVRRKTVKIARNFSTQVVKKDVLFVGYVEGALGLGHSLRNDILAADAAGLRFSVFPLRDGIEARMIGPHRKDRYDHWFRHGVNIIAVAADEMGTVRNAIGPGLAGGYNILRTYWELPRAPEAWREKLRDIHELWVPNAFVGDAFRPIFSGPITIIPPVVEADAGDLGSASTVGLDPDTFNFLFSFDYLSSPHRKNPLGVIAAFQQAFPVEDRSVGLLVKSTGRDLLDSGIPQLIEEAAARDPRIRLLDGFLPQPDFYALMQKAGAYVSLHRSEGFGYGMAEAMLFERPVIATRYSGCTEFITPETAFPVTFTERALRPREYPFGEGQVWAEPDVGAAALAMRMVRQDPDDAATRARNGRALVERIYSRETVGAAMADRLKTIGAAR